MANFKQVIKWLREGKKVRRESWPKKLYLRSSEHVWNGEEYHRGIFFFEDYTDDTRIASMLFQLKIS